MNILDIIILICLIPALIQGIIKGFISQAISIISLILGAWASARFATVVYQWLAQYFSGSEQVLKTVSFVLIFVVVIVVLILLGKLLEKVIKLIMLGWLNRLLGAVFALVKWLLVMGLLAVAFNSINETLGLVKPDVIAQSHLYPILTDIADSVFPYLKNLLTA